MSKPKARHEKQRMERRQRIGKELSSLAEKDSYDFRQAWATRMDSWLVEIAKRGKNLQRVYAPAEAWLSVYKIYKGVDRFLLDNPRIDRVVGEQTRQVLLNACAKSVASAVDPRMYKLVMSYRRL
jgi:hypothetical protein